MPSLVLTGYPCSGKTTFSHLLAERALQHKSKSIHHVIIVNEELARPGLTKASCYENSNAEKFTRAALKTEFDKYCRSSSINSLPSSINVKKSEQTKEEASFTKDTTLVILDSLNYIKGYRYELHCIAKAANQKHAVIWLLCSQNVAKSWNTTRRRGGDKNHMASDGQTNDGNESYPDHLMDELMQRFEPPDQRNRWDQPLYRVDVDSTLSRKDTEPFTSDAKDRTGDVAEHILNSSVYNMHSLRDAIHDESQTIVRTSKTAFRRFGQSKVTDQLAPASDTNPSYTNTTTTTHHASTIQNEESITFPTRSMEDIIDEILDSFIIDVQPLKQGLSTKAEIAASVNILNDVDSICQQVINAFINSQKMSNVTLGSGGSGKVSVSLTNGKNFTIDCKRTVQLIELRRFMRQYIKMVSTHPPADTSRDGISVSFLSYISSQL